LKLITLALKLITSLVGMIALRFVTSALAQEEHTASLATEETPPTIIKETSAAASQSKLAAVSSDKQMRVTAMLKNNENRWFAAIAKHDILAIASPVKQTSCRFSSAHLVVFRRSLLRRERGDDLFEARIAAERIPKWEELQLTIAKGARIPARSGKLFTGEFVLANPRSDHS